MAVAIAQAGNELHTWARRPGSLDALGQTPYIGHDDLEGLAAASAAKAPATESPCVRGVSAPQAADWARHYLLWPLDNIYTRTRDWQGEQFRMVNLELAPNGLRSVRTA